MLDSHFRKEEFKKSVKENVKMLYRKTLDEASQEQIFQAVSLAVKDVVIDNWLLTQKQYEKDDPKIVYYLSMEFLMGRALGNNLINLCAYKEVKEALDELGLDLNTIEDQEPDPALGNGGLGRLAACFLDSLATLGYCAYGCGIRYHYGLFKQKIENGYQVEVPDNWLKDGYPFELRRPEYAKEVKFGGYVRVEYDPATGRNNFIQEGYQSVRAVPYDMPIVGYNNKIVNGISENMFGSGLPVTRQDMCTMIYNAVSASGTELDKKFAQKTFEDNDVISPYAAEAVAVLQTAGIISGDENNEFKPQDGATRAEAAVMLQRLLAYVSVSETENMSN